jgi:hypothetical protein
MTDKEMKRSRKRLHVDSRLRENDAFSAAGDKVLEWISLPIFK